MTNRRKLTIYSLKVWFVPVLLIGITNQILISAMNYNLNRSIGWGWGSFEILYGLISSIAVSLAGWLFFRLSLYRILKMNNSNIVKKSIINFVIIVCYLLGTVLSLLLLTYNVGIFSILAATASLVQLMITVLFFTISVWLFKLPRLQ